MSKRTKPTVADLLHLLGSTDSGGTLTRTDGEPVTQAEVAAERARVAEMVSSGKVCWCACREMLDGEPECPMHPDAKPGEPEKESVEA